MSRYDKTKVIYENGAWGWVFFVAYVGAFIHFFTQTPNFGGFLAAIFQAAVWPAYVVYEVLGLLGVK